MLLEVLLINRRRIGDYRYACVDIAIALALSALSFSSFLALLALNLSFVLARTFSRTAGGCRLIGALHETEMVFNGLQRGLENPN
jgi:hypothetical protein